MSTAGGLAKAVDRAVAAGCRTLQSSRRTPTSGPVRRSTRRLAAFRKAARERASRHSSRTRPTSSTSRRRTTRSGAARSTRSSTKSFDATRPASRTSSSIPARTEGTETKPGSTGSTGLDEAVRKSPGSRTTILLETAAGRAPASATRSDSSRRCGSVRRRRRGIGFCLDTCHVHAAGYDVVTRMAGGGPSRRRPDDRPSSESR